MAETILVVGSKPIDQQSVIWSLLKANYQVRYAANNSSVVEIIAAETPNAVLLSLESDNTQEICSLIRSVAPATPLLVIGREHGTALKVSLFQADVDDYVQEPFDSSELIARIRSAVRRSKKNRFINS
jgi:DNA-binding response OmpR family regulator